MTRIIFTENDNRKFEYLYGYVPDEDIKLSPIGNTLGRAFLAYTKASYGPDRSYAMAHFIGAFVNEVGVTEESLTNGSSDSHLHHLGRLLNQAEPEVEELRLTLYEDKGALSGSISFAGGRTVSWQSDLSESRILDSCFIMEQPAQCAAEGETRIVETETSLRVDLSYKTVDGAIGLASLAVVSHGYTLIKDRITTDATCFAWAQQLYQVCQVNNLHITPIQEALLRGMRKA